LGASWIPRETEGTWHGSTSMEAGSLGPEDSKLPIGRQEWDRLVQLWDPNRHVESRQGLPSWLSRDWLKRYHKNIGHLNRIHTELPSRTLCRMDEGTIRTTYELAEMGENTTYRLLSPERTPLQIWTNQRSHLRKMHERRWNNLTCFIWLWGHWLSDTIEWTNTREEQDNQPDPGKDRLCWSRKRHCRSV
jgi:hypothetical protein